MKVILSGVEESPVIKMINMIAPFFKGGLRGFWGQFINIIFTKIQHKAQIVFYNFRIVIRLY
jgi:hypothetical protein